MPIAYAYGGLLYCPDCRPDGAVEYRHTELVYESSCACCGQDFGLPIAGRVYYNWMDNPRNG